MYVTTNLNNNNSHFYHKIETVSFSSEDVETITTVERPRYLTNHFV